MKKILLVEDDEFLIDTYKSCFEPSEYTVSYARDGEEALKILESSIPDLIILDLIMPKKGGIEILKELRASEKYKKIPVIVASNIDQKEVQQQAMALGAKDFFIKSNISIEELVGKCSKYMQ